MIRARHTPLHLLCLIALLGQPALALIIGDIGNKPVHDRNWRTGAVDLANLPSRIGWWEGPPFGGGEYQFLYRGDTAAFNAALRTHAKIRAPKLEVHLHDGPFNSFYLEIPRGEKDKVDPRCDWTFTIWDAQSFHHLNNNPTSRFGSQSPNYRRTLPAPRIDVYIGGGQIDWAKVEMPKGIEVIDHRASAAGVDTRDGSVISGSIYDMVTSKPLSVASVIVTSTGKEGKEAARGRCDADGRFTVGKIPAGTYRVHVEAEGYAPRDLAYDKLNGRDARQFEAELAPEAVVRGRVVDDAGAALAAAKVVVYEPMGIDGRGYSVAPREPVVTDADGRFEIRGLPRGYVTLSVWAKGYHHNSVREKPITTPADDVVLKAVRAGSIKGKVVDSANKPAQNAQVFVQEIGGAQVGSWGGSMNVAPDATFAFENVPPGKYLIATKPFLPGTAAADAQTIEVSGGKATEVELSTK